MKTSIVTLMLAFFWFSSTCFAGNFLPGDYRIEFWIDGSSQKASDQLLDVQCHPVKNIGWKMFSKSPCKLLQDSSIGSSLRYDLQCDDEAVGQQDVSIAINLAETAFQGTADYKKDKLKVKFGGQRIESCAASATKDPLASATAFKDYLKAKYHNVEDRTEFDVKVTSNGPSGSFWIRGNISPLRPVPANPDRDTRARAIAQAFLDEELALLGVPNADELREWSVSSSPGFGGVYTNLYYKRLINGVEGGSGVQVTIGPDFTITTVTADLVAVTPEMYSAAAKITLTQEQIEGILEADHDEKDRARYPKNMIRVTFRKYLVNNPPYVLCDVLYRYNYKVNAFTGEIIEKRSPIIH